MDSGMTTDIPKRQIGQDLPATVEVKKLFEGRCNRVSVCICLSVCECACLCNCDVCLKV